jgi:hypothetical protein
MPKKRETDWAEFTKTLFDIAESLLLTGKAKIKISITYPSGAKFDYERSAETIKEAARYRRLKK